MTSQASCFFVAGFADGSLRLPQDVAKVRSRSSREAWSLPRPPWFEASLRQAAALHGHFAPGQIVLLVSASQGKEIDATLTALHSEEELLWDYFFRPLDAYSMMIESAIVIAVPVVVGGAAKGRTKCRCQFASLIAPPLDIGALTGYAAHRDWSPEDPAPLLDASQIQRHLGVDDVAWRVLSSHVPFLYLPMPLLQLLASRRWSYLLFIASWDARFGAGKPAGSTLFE